MVVIVNLVSINVLNVREELDRTSHVLPLQVSVCAKSVGGKEMILVKPSFEVMTKEVNEKIYRLIELAGRTAYKSEDKITDNSAQNFIRTVIKRGHESVIEHFNITVKFICDRGVTHELVRHRLVSYTQESTRYCNYKGGVTFVIPSWLNLRPGEYKSIADLSDRTTIPSRIWFEMMLLCEKWYTELLNQGWSPQQARSVLPNSLKTEIATTCNVREWRHILKLRTAGDAHPQMQEIMIPLLNYFKTTIPVLFEDL